MWQLLSTWALLVRAEIAQQDLKPSHLVRAEVRSHTDAPHEDPATFREDIKRDGVIDGTIDWLQGRSFRQDGGLDYPCSRDGACRGSDVCCQKFGCETGPFCPLGNIYFNYTQALKATSCFPVCNPAGEACCKRFSCQTSCDAHSAPYTTVENGTSESSETGTSERSESGTSEGT
mmetsp:Transcript_135596/g.234405  ORF Transcript_135596/g.234405 Transcript_135596/m.234405 type:complete len:175 (+) Transcript_135596:65-589(+)